MRPTPVGAAGLDPQATVDPPETGPGGQAITVPGRPVPRDHSAATVDAGGTAETFRPPSVELGDAPRTPRFPIRDWDRYEPLRFLGQGGMGVVFLARDTLLQREVAIKFVRGDDPARMRRLVSEARAQARVNHENVCRVYEVGELDDRIFITMQFVDGEPLGGLVGKVPIETLALLVRDAALGLHEAHRAGIVHRDVKPNNILVSRSPDGALKPYVMDFGIAFEWDGAATAAAGTAAGIMGTPLYMSPEQARGGTVGIDRRADVYSLGATLYQLLTRLPPVPGVAPLEVLNNIASVEPRAPRSIDPLIPVDLEAICLKCLEKDRSARYESARALAEDLDRFLRGEPVLARPTGVLYRLQKRVRRNWRAWAASGAVTLALLTAIGWGLATRSQASRRETLVRRFTERVEHIEAMARYSALSPLHDVGPDREAIRTAMAELDSAIAAAGALGEGPGHYALGRGYLALDDQRRAREHLEHAWNSGYRAPRAAYSLALVLGQSYQEQLIEAERIRDPDERERRRGELMSTLREPLLGYLRQSEGALVPSVDYVAALVALYEERWDDALARLDRIGGGLRWFYEAPELRGAIHMARATHRANQGDREGALRDFAAGRAALQQAAAVGESVPSVYARLGELEHNLLHMELYSSGDVVPPYERGMAAVERALGAQSDHYESLVLACALRRQLAEYRGRRDEDTSDLITRAIDYGERAIAVSPQKSRGRIELARSWYQWGDLRQERGLDPRPQLEKALALLDTFPPDQRDFDVRLYTGLVHSVMADRERSEGRDPLPSLALAIEAYQQAIAASPRRVEGWIDLAGSYSTRAAVRGAADPVGDLTRAASALDRARELNPRHYVVFYQGALVALGRALRTRDADGDARPELGRAVALCEQGIAINPKSPQLRSLLGEALLYQARAAWERGEDPEPFFERSSRAYRDAIAAAPDQISAQANLGEMLTWRARYRAEAGLDAGPLLKQAVDAIERAVEHAPDDTWTYGYLAAALALRAQWEAAHGRDPHGSASAAAKAIERARASDPDEAGWHASLALAAEAQARYLGAQGRSPADALARATRELRQAVAMSPDDPDLQIERARFLLRTTQLAALPADATAARLGEGIEACDAALRSRPTWAEARAVRARLLRDKARVEGATPAMRAAEAELARAVGDNPNLRVGLGDLPSGAREHVAVR